MTDFVQNAKTGKWSIPKDPNAVLDYIEDWTTWLDAVSDTLAGHAVTVTSGTDPASNVTLNSSVISGKKVHAWISGGAVGETVTVVYHVVTAAGRQDDRTFYLKIKER